MDAPSKPLAADLSPAESKKWMGRLLIAVILGAAIWNFVASLTSAVIVPGLARVMEADPGSPLYLGKGDFNVPVVFASVLELCLALIVALVVSSWSQRGPKLVRRKAANVARPTNLSISAPAPAREPVSPPLKVSAVTPPPLQQSAPPAAVPQVPVAQTSAPPPPAKAEKPTKPKAPKEVYYNLVGEPVERDDE